jgi:uncharacterized protein YkvS
MVNKQNFTPEEWAKILESMMLAGMAVSAAEPSGLWGTVKEAFASRSAIVASKHSASNELVQAAIAELETREGRSTVQGALRNLVAGAEPPEIVQRALDNLREVSALLDAKAPGDAAAFKDVLRGISQKVAEASVEGGLLGLGGHRVSDHEKATLADIEKALGTTT